MSLLNFLRVIDTFLPETRGAGPIRRHRHLELEKLERRAVLAVLESTATALVPVETTDSTFVESSTLTDTSTTDSTVDSGSGTTESTFTDGGSGSGTGDPSLEAPPEGDAGTGTGSEAPVITSLEADHGDLLVWFTGTVTDADGPVVGLTVYFVVGNDTSYSFTAVVDIDGTFSSIGMPIEPGTEVRAYTIDVDGNQSLLVTCFA
jgi:hypothetical protein